ncbi:MAG TPA: SIMPL domain-containing protein [Terriglobia bacterium]|nr:SIMPL domain-containing protein [Terriglobia bacterium]
MGCVSRLLVLLSGVIAISGAVLHAQQILHPPALPSLRVHGEATVSVKADQAQIDVGVVTEANTARGATEQNNKRSDALTRGFRAAFPTAVVKSINFSVTPNYRYERGGTPVLASYTANNTVHLLLNEVSSLPAAIRIAINSGANSIDRLDFTLRNETPVRTQALAEAARQAEAGAQALAAALDVKLGKLLSVEEAQPVVVALPRVISFAKLQSASIAPISPGTVDVHASVELIYEIAQPAKAHPESLHAAGHR